MFLNSTRTPAAAIGTARSPARSLLADLWAGLADVIAMTRCRHSNAILSFAFFFCGIKNLEDMALSQRQG